MSPLLRKSALAAFVTAWVAIPAASQAQPPGPGTIQASNAFVGCLIRAADKSDDGHSDAAGLGKSIQNACLAEQDRWEKAQTANYSADKRRDFLEKMRAQTAAIAVQTVLANRRAKFGK